MPHRIWLCWLIFMGSGCSVVYDHRLESSGGVLFSNHPQEVTAPYMNRLSWASEGIRQQLPLSTERVRPVTVFLSGTPADSGTVIRRYQTGFAGWYSSLLNSIWLSGDPDDDGTSILLKSESLETFQHELAHHMTSNIDGIQRRWWLVEGIACFFEGGFDPGDGGFSIPPIHLKFYEKCRRELRRRGRQQFLNDLEETVQGNYRSFYSTDSELLYRYALSWALFWHLAETVPAESDLESRIRAISKLTDDQVLAESESLLDRLRKSTTERLREHLLNPELRRWAVDGMLTRYRSNGNELLEVLKLDLEASSDPIWAWCSVSKLLGSRGIRLTSSIRQEWIGRFNSFMTEATPRQKITICEAIIPGSRSFLLTDSIVDCLESTDPDLRVVAAKTLASISRQKTIVSPHFWANGDPDLRSLEVQSWRDYLQD